MPTTVRSGIEYTEIVEGYREAWRTNGNESVRVLECAWDERIAFMYDVLGFSFQNGDDFTLTRHLPEKHPDMSSAQNPLYATNAELLMGVGVPDIDPTTNLIRYLNQIPGDPVPGPGSEVFGRARYAVTYRARPYEIRPDSDIDGMTLTELDRWVERRQTYAAESLPLPGQGFMFESDSQKLQESVTKLLFTKELTYIWYEVPFVPETTIEGCLGRVNDAMFDGRYPAGTLLMIAPEITRTQNAAGDFFNYTIAYKFIYRQNLVGNDDDGFQTLGWNCAIRPLEAEFERIKFVGPPNANKDAPYLKADFNSLFDITEGF